MRVAAVALIAAACSSQPSTSSSSEPAAPARSGGKPLPPMLSSVELPATSGADPDGANDGQPDVLPEPLRALARGGAARWTELGPAPATRHPVVCDLIEHRDALYASHATDVINRTGSRIHRWRGGRWELAFDYDEGGNGWGGGQGLSRIREIDGRLVAVDSDSTSAGFFGVTGGVEAYLFVSDKAGDFARIDHGAPPRTVTIAGSIHSFDVISYRRRLVVTGGTGIQSNDRRTWAGALWASDPGESITRPRYGLGLFDGVVRTTFLHRFGGRLYVGFQNNEARVRFDLAVLTGDPLAETTPQPQLARVTDDGGWLTRRFASGGGELFWIASGYNYKRDQRPARLFRSTDGQRFDPVELPESAGLPQDLVAGRDARLLLTTTGVWAAWRGQPGWRKVAGVPPGDPFGRFSTFCSAPLAVYGNAVVAGSTRDGAVYELSPAAPPKTR